MLLWVSLLAGLLIVTTVLVVAMLRAERRARRALFRALELSEDTIELLMSRNGDVLSELTLVRISPPATPEADAIERAAQTPVLETPRRRHPTIRLVHPAADEPPASDDEDRPNSQRHRGV